MRSPDHDWLMNYEFNKFVSNTVTAVGVGLVLAWNQNWHGLVLAGLVMLANVTGHGEGLTREYRR